MRSAPRRAAARLVTPLIAGFALSVLSGALPAAAADDRTTPDGCTVTAADLDWGFKESFRSYISGRIADGDWTTTGAATYETPTFAWSDGAGVLDATASTGSVAFEGGIVFSGHDDLLESVFENPALVVDGDRGSLVLDVVNVEMETALAGEREVESALQIPFVEIDLSAATVVQDGASLTLTVVDAPTALTAEGAAEFSFYPADTEFDPLSFALVADCPEAAAADESSAVPLWLPIGAVALVVVVAGLLTATSVARRRRAAASADDATSGPVS